jgi:hypothetical protein
MTDEELIQRAIDGEVVGNGVRQVAALAAADVARLHTAMASCADTILTATTMAICIQLNECKSMDDLAQCIRSLRIATGAEEPNRTRPDRDSQD